MPTVSSHHRRTESAARATPAGTDYRGEHVTLRNHDHRSGYGLTICLRRPGGRVIERTDYYLGSGTTKRLFDVAAPGPVHAEVVHAGNSIAETACRLDDTPAGTIVVECGNGVVTATAGWD
jgi:hypothetical protein